MNIKIGAADIARAMGFYVERNWETKCYEVRTPPCEVLISGEDWEDEDDVAQQFFYKLAREVFLK